MIHDTTATLSVYPRLSDRELHAEIERLELRLDRLDDASWPNAARQRAEAADALAAALRELDRRRT